ncbi:MAG TPA: ABC transporter ATP-binding protein [Actinomycetes bacterium]|jgi:putative ABC transport system ATP-binding protein|nr:ABC transporter ATP-binding protein [Actinomycetes bacterium]
MDGTAHLPVVDARGVTKVYRMEGVEVRALDGVDLTVRPGDSLAIMGPSGSGKSTLLGLLGGLDRPSSGSLAFEGRDVATLSDDDLARVRNQVVGFVFQNFQLLPRTTALANVGLPLVYRGVSRSERRRRATEVLQAVGLGHRLQHRPSQLSGGEQQRAAIARALAAEPAMLLADEPTGNLDSHSGEEVLDLLAHLHAERGVAVVVVTHDPGVAARFGRTVVMRDGRLVPAREAAAMLASARLGTFGATRGRG